jgi:hypothetical protein
MVATLPQRTYQAAWPYHGVGLPARRESAALSIHRDDWDAIPRRLTADGGHVIRVDWFTTIRPPHGQRDRSRQRTDPVAGDFPQQVTVEAATCCPVGADGQRITRRSQQHGRQPAGGDIGVPDLVHARRTDSSKPIHPPVSRARIRPRRGAGIRPAAGQDTLAPGGQPDPTAGQRRRKHAHRQPAAAAAARPAWPTSASSPRTSACPARGTAVGTPEPSRMSLTSAR